MAIFAPAQLLEAWDAFVRQFASSLDPPADGVTLMKEG
jgi:hypothetical protein